MNIQEKLQAGMRLGRTAFEEGNIDEFKYLFERAAYNCKLLLWQALNKKPLLGVNGNLQDTSSTLFIDASHGYESLGIGDCMFQLPSLSDLSEAKGSISVLTTPARAVIFKNQKSVTDILTLDPKNLSNPRLSTSVFTSITCLHHSLGKYELSSKLSGSVLPHLGVSPYYKLRSASPRENHIALMRKALSELYGYPCDWKSSITLPNILLDENVKLQAKLFLDRLPGDKKICISVGYKDHLKNYTHLDQVTNILKLGWSSLVGEAWKIRLKGALRVV